MIDTMTRYLEAIKERVWSYNLRRILLPIVDRYSSVMVNNITLQITAGGATTFSNGGADAYAVASGGVYSVGAGVAAATLAGVQFPQQAVGQALLGVLIITYASQFVGGTTPLDTATTVYANARGPFDPTVLV